jgi:hypothetical protein
MEMNRNWIIGLVMAAISLMAIVFIIKGDLTLAVLFMTAMFALTNGFRSMNLKKMDLTKKLSG